MSQVPVSTHTEPPADALWSQLVRDLAHIKALRKRAEAGDLEAAGKFWELARGMEVKMAIRRGMVEPGESREA